MVTDGELTYRRAHVEDVVALVGIVVRCDAAVADFAPPGWVPPPADGEAERLAELIGDPANRTLVAARGTRPVGFATVRPADRPAGGHLANLFVDPHEWGAGIGRALLSRAEDAMRAAGYEWATLSTQVANARARGIYERAGWADTGDRHMHADLGMEMAKYERRL